MERKGFTLIELLVVIAIIAILAAILFPVFANARNTAQKAQCSSNMKQLAMAYIMYAEDHDDALLWVQYPPWPPPYYHCWWWRLYISNYTMLGGLWVGPKYTTSGVWLCPSRRLSRSMDWASPDYCMNDVAVKPNGPASVVSDIQNPTRQFLMGETPNGYFVMMYGWNNFPQNHLGGANFSYFDGHVTWKKLPLTGAIKDELFYGK